jgi:hypothetical protein
MAGPEVRGEEFRAPRGGTMVPGEHANVATAVLQPRDDKLPEAAGAAGNKGSPYAVSPVTSLMQSALSHRRGLDGQVYDRQRPQNVTDERT